MKTFQGILQGSSSFQGVTLLTLEGGEHGSMSERQYQAE